MQSGRDEAQRLIDEAMLERTRLLSETEIMQGAHSEADEMLAGADADVARMRREVDDYVDAKLANFEIVLHKTLGAVERGREKIHGRSDELERLSDAEDIAAEPLPG